MARTLREHFQDECMGEDHDDRGGKDDIMLEEKCPHCGNPGPECTCIKEHSIEPLVDEVAPPGWENTVKGMKKHHDIKNPWALAWSMKNKGEHHHEGRKLSPLRVTLSELRSIVRSELKRLNEERSHVSPQEVEQVYADLFAESGPMSIDVLASWMATTEEAVMKALPETFLTVDPDGMVVEDEYGFGDHVRRPSDRPAVR